jgi:hypothetical protein
LSKNIANEARELSAKAQGRALVLSASNPEKNIQGIKFGKKMRGIGEAATMSGIPTVKFDASMVTEIVKADLGKNILLLGEIDKNHFEQVYDAALRSISAGRDLSLLYNVLMQMNINGMTKRSAVFLCFLFGLYVFDKGCKSRASFPGADPLSQAECVLQFASPAATDFVPTSVYSLSKIADNVPFNATHSPRLAH